VQVSISNVPGSVTLTGALLAGTVVTFPASPQPLSTTITVTGRNFVAATQVRP
jgi:hypothetical protein